MKRQSVVLIPGEGIGPEITAAVRSIFEVAEVPVDWIEASLQPEPGHSDIPETTLSLIERHQVALKGPTATPFGFGHRSFNVALRKRLGLFANLRPIRSIPALVTPFRSVDISIVRENIEDTYAGIEYLQSPNVAEGSKLISRSGTERCVRFAFEYARSMKRKKVTCIHKANIHKLTDGLFLEVFKEVSQEYPEFAAEDLLVDNTCMQLVKRPEMFDVMVLPNLYGDILSDLVAGLVGGLGVAPSGNIGNGVAVFEAVHGTAPDIAGKELANPTAILLSAIMMLRYIGLTDYASRIEQGLFSCFEAGDTTRDVGGRLSTPAFAEAVGKAALRATAETVAGNGVLSSVSISTARPIEIADQIYDGVDVHVNRTSFPDAPESVGRLSLRAVANRGSQVEPNDSPERHAWTDVFCLRYVSAGPLQNADVSALLQELEARGLRWVDCRKLLNAGDSQGYSSIE